MIVLRDLDSKQYRVESQLAEGGEGVICTLVGKPQLVVKLYKPIQRTAEREAKLLAMLEAPPRDEMLVKFKHASISWPITVVREESGGFAGFLMSRIDAGYGLINAYNIRAAKFLKFNWHEQHQVAANLCAALHSLHIKGYVVGDVNERNILVTKNGLVTLVDTDSFQVQRQDGRIFRCGVGVPEYTPAELHGKAFDQVDRLPQHDNFGLAVLIFRLLMRGQHPFNAAQKDLSLSVGKVDEYCIRSGIFPWLEHAQFMRPPSAKDLDVLHSGLQILFGQAFVIGHKHPHLRPTAIEWLRALDTAKGKLTRCGTGAHWLQTGRVCGDCGVVVPSPPQPLPPSQPSTPLPPPSPPLPPPLMVSLRSFVALLVSTRWGWATALGLELGVLGIAYMIFVHWVPEQQKLISAWMVLEQAQRKFANEQALSGSSTVREAFEPEMVQITGGTFMMGSPAGEGYNSERPQHEVTVGDFAIGKYEVTNAQFRAFRSSHDSGSYEGQSLNSDQQPVVNVTWQDAVDYTKWLSQQTGKQYRLPSEAEWEYAARAGTSTARYWGDDSAQACNYANVYDETAKSQFSWGDGHACTDGYAVTAPVGQFTANGFGLHDILGNVWEWTQDRWHSYARAPADGSAWQEGYSWYRPRRGCSWNNLPDDCRSAFRHYHNYVFDVSYGSYGFRVVFRVAGRAF